MPKEWYAANAEVINDQPQDAAGIGLLGGALLIVDRT